MFKRGAAGIYCCLIPEAILFLIFQLREGSHFSCLFLIGVDAAAEPIRLPPVPCTVPYAVCGSQVWHTGAHGDLMKLNEESESECFLNGSQESPLRSA